MCFSIELIERPWRIVYRYDDKRVYVMAVLDARRDLAGVPSGETHPLTRRGQTGDGWAEGEERC